MPTVVSCPGQVLPGKGKGGLEYFSRAPPLARVKIPTEQASDTTTPQGMFSLQMPGAVAQLERALIAEHTKARLRAARSRGRSGRANAHRQPR